MYIRNWKKEILTIPNLLSLFRILLIPVYAVLYLRAQSREDYLLAGTVMAVSCLTDMIDGQIARRFRMISHLGKLLDPLADKLTQLTLMLCLSARYPMLYPLVALFLLKESFQIFAVIVHFRRGKVLPGALTAGKICTTVLFVSLIALVLFPDAHIVAVRCIILTDAVCLALTFLRSILAYYGRHRKIEDWNAE